MKKSKLSESQIDEINFSIWKRRYLDTENVLAESIAVCTKSGSQKYFRGIAYAKLNIAASCILQSKNEMALENLYDALKWFSERPSDPGYARALYLKANIEESFGEYEKALEHCLLARKLSSQNNDRDTEAEASSQLGLIYTRLCNFPRALEFYRQALSIREELADENAIASSLNRIGMLMRLTRKYEESLEYYLRSHEIRRKNKQVDSIPWTLLGIACTYEDLGNKTEALNYFEQGMIGADKRCNLQCMMGAGRIYSQTGNEKEAEKKLLESLRMANELQALSLIAEAYSALAEHYESTGNIVRALQSYKLFQKTNESFRSDQTQSRIRNIEISHAIEKSENEKEIYRLRNVELKSAYDIIEEKNRDITASLNYAGRIQRSILQNFPDIEILEDKCFVLFIPKEIVSGDFYWFAEISNKLLIASADCTDHGVPGALMTMLGISFLEEIVKKRGITDPAVILNELRREVKKTLHQTGRENEEKNGMDISLCAIEKTDNLIEYSGAFNNLYLIRDSELTEYKADLMPIGIYEEEDTPFSKHEIKYYHGDTIYMFSDGYADQFGGPDHKKFRYAALKSLLLKINSFSLKDQKEKLEKEFYTWKGNYEQTDDVLIVGLRV